MLVNLKFGATKPRATMQFSLFANRMKYLARNKEGWLLWMEKAFDRVPRDSGLFEMSGCG